MTWTEVGLNFLEPGPPGSSMETFWEGCGKESAEALLEQLSPSHTFSPTSRLALLEHRAGPVGCLLGTQICTESELEVATAVVFLCLHLGVLVSTLKPHGIAAADYSKHFWLLCYLY